MALVGTVAADIAAAVAADIAVAVTAAVALAPVDIHTAQDWHMQQ